MESQAQRRDLLLSFKETDIALNYLLNMFIPTWSLIQRTLSSQWTAPSARDSWLPKIPRISHSCGLSPKQDIYITHSKAKGILWERGQKEYRSQQKENIFWTRDKHCNHNLTTVGVCLRSASEWTQQQCMAEKEVEDDPSLMKYSLRTPSGRESLSSVVSPLVTPGLW